MVFELPYWNKLKIQSKGKIIIGDQVRKYRVNLVIGNGFEKSGSISEKLIFNNIIVKFQIKHGFGGKSILLELKIFLRMESRAGQRYEIDYVGSGVIGPKQRV